MERVVGTDINLLVAVTDGDWFDVLRKQPNLREVNFWSPSAKGFKALKKGELFLFKLRAKRNGGMIVGGGVFIYANELPCRWRGRRSGRVTAHSPRPRCGKLLCAIAKTRWTRTIGATSRLVAGY